MQLGVDKDLLPDLLELLFHISPVAMLWVWLAVNRKGKRKTEVRQPSSPLLTSSLGDVIPIQPTPVPSSLEGNMEQDFMWSYKRAVWSDGKKGCAGVLGQSVCPNSYGSLCSLQPSAPCPYPVTHVLWFLCPSLSSLSRLRNSFLWIRLY